MTAALCCPGPSLPRTFPGRGGFDLVVAVNAAAAFVRSPDVWAALDLPCIIETSPGVSACRLLTCANTLNSLQRRQHHRAAGAAVTVESLDCPVPLWSLYTATAAMVWLDSVGATDVKVYGADWTPEAGEARSAERFAREREIWDNVTAWMTGASVDRVCPPASLTC